MKNGAFKLLYKKTSIVILALIDVYHENGFDKELINIKNIINNKYDNKQYNTYMHLIGVSRLKHEVYNKIYRKNITRMANTWNIMLINPNATVLWEEKSIRNRVISDRSQFLNNEYQNRKSNVDIDKHLVEFKNLLLIMFLLLKKNPKISCF